MAEAAIASPRDREPPSCRDFSLPTVRHRIQSSAQDPNKAETRTDMMTPQRRWVVRCGVGHADQKRAIAWLCWQR